MTKNDNSDKKMENIPMPLLLTYKQTAQILGLGCRSVMYLADEDKVERVYPRKRSPRITHASVLAFVESMSKSHTQTTYNKDRKNKPHSKSLDVRPNREMALKKERSSQLSINTQKLLSYLK